MNNMTGLFEQLGNILMPLIKEVFQDIIPLIKPIGDILQKVFGVVVPILQKILPVVNGVMTKVADEIIKVMDILQPIIDIIMEIIDSVMGAINDALGSGGLTQIFDAFVPVLTMVVQEISQLWKFLQPLFQIMLKIFGKEMQIAMGIISRIFGGVVKLLPPLFTVANFLVSQIVPIVDWVFQKIEKLYDWIAKLLHFTKEASKEQETMLDKMEKSVIQSQKTLNLDMNNEININTPGLTPSDMQNAMGTAARGIFTIELKKILQTAM